MDILTKNIDLELNLPITTESIYNALAKRGIEPLRFAVVKVSDDILTLNVSYENLC